TAEKTVNRGSIWPVTTTRQPGSSIKPLSVYGPAIEMGLITPASVIDDNPYLLNGKVWPLNVSADYRGLTTVQYAVTVSLNTVALRVVEMVTPQASYDFMVNKFGFTSMEPYYVRANGQVVSDIDRSPLSMGGLTWGVSTFEMAAAYATFPRNGEFTKATTVLEIKDANGNTIVDNRPKSEFIIKPETAYYINSMLTNVVTSGTGTGARIAGQTVAGKTGTTNDVYDYWFCGYTKYYTAAVWTGYPNGEVINYNHRNPGVPLWQKVMTILHEDKENVAFDVPGTLNTYSVCLDCGKLATSDCGQDVRGNRTQTFRLFAADAPTGFCECHKQVKVCVDSPILDANGVPSGRYYLAGEFCPEESVKTVTMVDYERELAKPGLGIGDASALLNWSELLPAELRYCHVHTTVEPPESPEPPEPPEPGTSEEPTWPPVESYEPFIPPIWEPTPPPTNC
ncbi:MAG: transglycosylase, partial [Oscillospiraceae bacterium]|nr:transglycosylase [Oscillospiraceae bacterium]